MLSCPECGRRLAQHTPRKLKLRLGPVIAFVEDEDGSTVCETSCPGCKADIRVPLSYHGPSGRPQGFMVGG